MGRNALRKCLAGYEPKWRIVQVGSQFCVERNGWFGWKQVSHNYTNIEHARDWLKRHLTPVERVVVESYE